MSRNPKALGLGLGQTDTAAFRAWFGASKVVAACGSPLMVYRGVTTDVPSVIEPSDFFGANFFGRGINLTSSALDASRYASVDVQENFDLPGKASIMAERLGVLYNEAKAELTKGGGAVMPVFVSMQNPLTIGAAKLIVPDAALRLALAETAFDGEPDLFVWQFNRADSAAKQFDVALNHRATQVFRQIASLQNKDGLIIRPEFSPKSGGATHYLAFESTQIKSALGNRGTFSPDSPDIRCSNVARERAR
jgi:hypothetical protein